MTNKLEGRKVSFKMTDTENGKKADFYLVEIIGDIVDSIVIEGNTHYVILANFREKEQLFYILPTQIELVGKY